MDDRLSAINNLPTFEEIQKWSTEKLQQVIKSGESINWMCGMGESQSEIDLYAETLYSEIELR